MQSPASTEGKASAYTPRRLTASRRAHVPHHRLNLLGAIVVIRGVGAMAASIVGVAGRHDSDLRLCVATPLRLGAGSTAATATGLDRCHR